MYIFLNESMSNFSKMFKVIIQTWTGITFSCKYLLYVNVGHRWNNHDKAIALALYFRSHQAYCVLNKLFSMPSASTLLRFVRGIRVTSGMSDSIFNLLEIKSKVMDDQSKCCVIVFDEMSLRQQLCYDRSRDTVDGLVEMPKKQAQPCNEALVFMVRGLTVNWKQTIAFYFSRNVASPADLDRLLRIIVEKTSCHQIATSSNGL